jgi:cadmium resistance protein CadD (predicted permease)
MTHVLQLVGQAVGLFISTDLDDVLVLLGFLADPRFRVRQIVAGQFIGIAILFCASVVGSWVSLIMPRAFIGLLGLVPLTMGVRSAWQLWRPAVATRQVSNGTSPAASTSVAAVVAVTVANGGDNISVYIPLFAMRSGAEIALIGVVFAIMTTLWLCLAYWLTRHRSLGAPVRRFTRVLMPFVFITLGVIIIYQAGTLTLLGHTVNRNL